MKKIFVNPTVTVLSVEMEDQILAGSGGNIVGGTANGNQNTGDGGTKNGDGLARENGGNGNPSKPSISAYELN